MLALGTAALSLSVLAGQALGQTVNEAEPNQSKATATPVVLTTAGDGILGTIHGFTTGSSTSTTGSATADYFKITVPAATPGIYRYELQFFPLAGPDYHTITIRGLTVSSGTVQPGTDDETQATSASMQNYLTAFYASGSAVQVYYRVTGYSFNSTPYEVEVVRSTETPTVVPQTLNAGPITISTINHGAWDTSFVVLDSNFVAVPTFQNDNATTAGGAPSESSQSYCTRTLPAGTYYVAVSNSRVTADQPAPSDDGNQDKPVLDFPGVVLASSAGAPDPTSVLITDGCRIALVPANAPDELGLAFVQFTVGTPDTPCVALSTSSLTMGAPGTFYATVTPSSAPNSAIAGVTADLSAFGGSATETMYNDGVTGGDAAVDDIWTAQITLGNRAGSVSFYATATDVGGRQATNVAYVPVALAVPSNDLCTNALVLSGLSETPTSFFISTYFATDDGVVMNCINGSTHNGIWFSYTPPTSCLLSMSGGAYMAVFDATPGCGNLGEPISCYFNDSTGVHALLVGGTSYLIYFTPDPWNSPYPEMAIDATFSVSYPVAPPNDLCGSAIEVDTDDLPFSDTLQLAGAGGDPFMSACIRSSDPTITSAANSIWYHVTNGNSYCRLQINQAGADTVQSTAFTGPCSALEEVYCHLSNSTFVMSPNTAYYFQFFTTRYIGSNGTITVDFIACDPPTHLPPPNDHCDQAIVTPDGLYPTATPYTNSQFVQAADRDSLVIDCNLNNPRLFQNNSIWYTYTPSQPVRVLIKQTSFTDAAWALFSGSCGNLSFLKCRTSDDSNNNFFDLEPCETYFICMYNETSNGDTNPEQKLDISLVTTLNGACQIGETCTYVTSAANCAGTFMGAGSMCENNTCCPADFNGVNGVTVQDIFDFLTAWLSGNASANFNGVNGVTVQDIFDFLTAWLAGC